MGSVRNVERNTIGNYLNRINSHRNIAYLAKLTDTSEIYPLCAEILTITYYPISKRHLCQRNAAKSKEYMHVFNDDFRKPLTI